MTHAASFRDVAGLALQDQAEGVVRGTLLVSIGIGSDWWLRAKIRLRISACVSSFGLAAGCRFVDGRTPPTRLRSAPREGVEAAHQPASESTPSGSVRL